jgi:uncharacterized protein YbbC (DUF1343 family)
MYPDSFTINLGFFDRLLGTEKFRETLAAGKIDSYFQNEYKSGLEDFLKKRQKYLIY